MKKRTSTTSTNEIIEVSVAYQFYGLLTPEERELKRKAYEQLISIEEEKITEVWSKRDKVLVEVTKAPRFYGHWKKSLEIINEVIDDIQNGHFDKKIKMAEKARKMRVDKHASGTG